MIKVADKGSKGDVGCFKRLFSLLSDVYQEEHFLVVTLINFIGREAIFAIGVEAFVTTKDSWASSSKARVFAVTDAFALSAFEDVRFRSAVRAFHVMGARLLFEE